MEFTYIFHDPHDKSDTPDVIGTPSDPDGEFIIRHPQYGEQVAHEIIFPVVPESSLHDETIMREHISPREEPGWSRLVNIVGYAAIRAEGRRSGGTRTIMVKVRDFKETVPYRPEGT